MGDQAGRRNSPKRQPRKILFDKKRMWMQLIVIVAIGAMFTYIITLAP